MKRTILLAVMVYLGFVNSFFKPGSEKTREENMKRKGFAVVMAAMLAVLGMGAFGVCASGVSSSERQALTDLYNSTSGTSWIKSNNWLGAVSTECSWYGITCSENHVTEIDLSSNNLSGSIPSSMGNLTNLTSLNLSDNDLTGIDNALLASSLTSLDLSKNKIEQDIPPGLGSLTNLKTLFLNGNYFKGEVPSELGNLTNLTDGGSEFRYNAIYTNEDVLCPSGSLCAFLNSKQSGNDWKSTQTIAPTNFTVDKSATTLTSIMLLWTKIPYTSNTGGYEIEYKKNKPGESYLLFDPTPPSPTTANKSVESQNVTNLDSDQEYVFRIRTVTDDHLENKNTLYSKYVPISSAPSTLSIPRSERDVLEELYSSTDGNNWNDHSEWLGDPGTECSWYGITCNTTTYHVTEIDLGGNNLAGTIPASIKELEELEELFLNDNQLSDTIPDDTDWRVGNFPKLTHLYLNDNQLSGTIPGWETGTFPELFDLRLGNNHLSGVIPQEIENLIKLTNLYVNGNQLEEPLPGSLVRLNLSSGGSDFGYNALDTSESALGMHIAAAQIGGNWKETQTIAPKNLNYDEPSLESTQVKLTWSAIDYEEDTGCYEIEYSTESASEEFNPYEGNPSPTVGGKASESFPVTGLMSNTDYWFRVRTLTKAVSGGNPNDVYSHYTEALSVHTPPSPKPEIYKLIPDEGPAKVRKTIEIVGDNFDSGAKALFTAQGRLPVEVDTIYIDEQHLTCTTPIYDDIEESKVVVKITIKNPDGEVSDTSKDYTYNPPPKITGTDKLNGCVNTPVEITGKNFKPDESGFIVKFGDDQEAEADEDEDEDEDEDFKPSETLIKYKAPSNDKGQVDIVVINPDGQTSKHADDVPPTFEYLCGQPTITQLLHPEDGTQLSCPASGGTKLSIEGTNFVAGNENVGKSVVKFSYEKGSAKWDETVYPSYSSSALLTDIVTPEFTIPIEEKVTVQVQVCNPEPDSRCSSAISFTYNPPPKVTKLSEDTGYELEQKTITISGSNIDSKTKTIKLLDPASSSSEEPLFATSLSDVVDGKITCRMPECPVDLSEGEEKCFHVVVVNLDGQESEPEDYNKFCYKSQPAPTITSIEKDDGTATGGLLVKIIGNGFISSHAGTTTVTFEGIGDVTARVLGEGELECNTPKCTIPEPQNGMVTVKVKVTNPDGQMSDEVDYTYVFSKIKLSDEGSKEGPIGGGTSVIIVPENNDQVESFDGASVKFGGVVATDCSILPEEIQIQCPTPEYSGDCGSVDVEVINPGKEPLICSGCYTYTCLLGSERDALIDLYVSTNGTGWADNTHWMEEEGTECTWKGVICNDGKDHVTKLILDSNELEGEIPESIQNFTYLQMISVPNNKLKNDVPQTILNLKNMVDGQSDFRWNNFCPEDDILRFMNEKQLGGVFLRTQECYVAEDAIIIEPKSLQVTEGTGTSESCEQENEFIIRLDSEPNRDVIINLFTSNITECDVSLSSVTLNKDNWEEGEKVCVTAQKDGETDGLKTCSIITEPVISADGNYRGVNPEDIAVFVYDADKGLTLNQVYPNVGLVNEELPVKLRGTSFVDTTKVYISKDGDEANKTEITNITFISSTQIWVTIPAQTGAGQYTLTVSEDGKEDEKLEAVTIMLTHADVAGQEKKKAIIVAGGGPYLGNALWTATKNCADRACLALGFQGYSHGSIRYLSSEASYDSEGFNRVDGEPTMQNLQDAIIKWAKTEEPADELLIYMTGHGGDGTFELEGGGEDAVTLEAETLDNWMDDLQTVMSGKLIFVYDACRSGSFLSELAADGKERFLISGATADERAWFLDDGEFSFSYLFWEAVENKGKLYTSFADAEKMMIDQTPLIDIDIDGDGTADTIDLSKDIQIGRGAVAAAGIRPDIADAGAYEKPVKCDINTATIYADNITPTKNILAVWARIVPPLYFKDKPLEDEVTYLPTVKLTEPDKKESEAEPHDYEGVYEGFDKTGEYNVSVFAIDSLGYESVPKTFDVKKEGKEECDLTGDFNGDGKVDLADAIIALQITAGVDISDINIDVNADVDGDGQIGLVDAVYVLEILADNKGDIDGNGSIELADAILALQIVTGITPPGSVSLMPDKDGKIDLVDAVFILQKLAGIR